MTEHDDLERRLARWFEAEAVGPALPGQRQDAIAATRTRRPRPAALARVGSGWVDAWPANDAPRLAWRAAAVLGLILLALAASAIYVGSQPRTLPAVVGPAGNGLIAYSSGGDIFVGDAATGLTTAIVIGPQTDARPVFSPDGSRIAFIRAEPGKDIREPTAVLVVRPDGTDRRVITPDAFGRFHDFLAWTPDGSGIVLNYENGLAVLDAEGVAEPQNLSPPLPKWRGAGYFDANDQVAAMFKPPTGDRILSYGYRVLIEHDSDGTVLRALIGPDRTDVRFALVEWPEWSPDGSKIAFAGDPVALRNGRGIFVMNGDGSDVRRLAEGGGAAWSPDGSSIAIIQADNVEAGSTAYCPDSWSYDYCASAAWITIVDVVSGKERILEGTRNVAGDEDAGIMGWSWAPDGRSLLILRAPETRLVTVDVETGRATELPWAADLPASWQRVATTRSR